MSGNRRAVPGRFADHAALVTGSTKGIGKAIAERLAAEGAAVVVTGRTTDVGEAVVEGIEERGGEATFVRANMRSPSDIEDLVLEARATYGDLDVLVNNAGVQTDTSASEASLEDWDLVVETDFRAYWLCAKHAVETMDAGAVVNVSSNHAFATTPGLFPYNAVKAGINGMTRAMAVDFAPDVRVNTVNPGYVEVGRNTEILSGERRESLEAIHPVGRVGQPEDVAGVVSFLASEDAAFVTGVSLLADGGRGALMQDDTLRGHK